VYDPRIGKFLSVDPLYKEYPWNSTYAFAENEPVSNVDLDGMEKVKAATQTAKTAMKVASKYGVEQGAKVVVMEGLQKTAENPSVWKNLGQGLGKVTGAALGTLIYVFTPVDAGLGGNPEGSTWWQEYQRIREMPNNAPDDGKGFMEDDDGDYIVLHRGVSSEGKYKLMYELAKSGIAIPMPLVNPVGGYLDMLPGGSDANAAYWHSASDNYTIWTSWTKDESTAKHFAKGPSGKSEGVVLTQKFKKSLLTPAHSDWSGLGEQEYLVPGIVLGADVNTIPGVKPPDVKAPGTTPPGNNKEHEARNTK
jgi:hypothetical protein